MDPGHGHSHRSVLQDQLRGCCPSVKLADGFSRGQSSVLAQEGQTVKLILCDEL